MTPDASLVADLHAYDPALRVRWARHSEKWIIERHQPSSDPRLAAAAPPAEDAPAIRHDLWEGWREGYVHVLTVARELAHWRFIAPELARMDSWRQGGMSKINDELDADAVKWDRQTDKRIDSWSEAAARDAHDHIAWFEKRRISVPDAIDTGHGFSVRDRRLA